MRIIELFLHLFYFLIIHLLCFFFAVDVLCPPREYCGMAMFFFYYYFFSVFFPFSIIINLIYFFKNKPLYTKERCTILFLVTFIETSLSSKIQDLIPFNSPYRQYSNNILYLSLFLSIIGLIIYSFYPSIKEKYLTKTKNNS